MFASQRSKHEVKVPYGYKKKSADGKDIIPDEAASVIVQYIFKLCAGGKGPSQIARILENEQILRNILYSGVWSRYDIAKEKRNETVVNNDGQRPV